MEDEVMVVRIYLKEADHGRRGVTSSSSQVPTRVVNRRSCGVLVLREEAFVNASTHCPLTLGPLDTRYRRGGWDGSLDPAEPWAPRRALAVVEKGELDRITNVGPDWDSRSTGSKET
jgi:hypothetical protein